MHAYQFVAALSAGAALGAAAAGQEPQPSEIIVTGSGEVLLAPNRFAALYEIDTEAPTRAEAIEQNESVAVAAREALSRLDGLAALSLETTSADLNPVRDPDCVAAQRATQDGCAIIAWRFERTLRILGGPPAAAGPVVAMGADLEVTQARLLGYELSDRDAGNRAADAAALADARANAVSLADGMGVGLGPVSRIQSGGGFRSRSTFDAPTQLRVSGSRSAPSVELTLDPEPIRIRSQVIVAFSIEGD